MNVCWLAYSLHLPWCIFLRGSCWIHLSQEYAYVLSCRIDLRLAGYVQYIKKDNCLDFPMHSFKGQKSVREFPLCECTCIAYEGGRVRVPHLYLYIYW